MKKILLFMLAALTVLTFVSCEGGGDKLSSGDSVNTDPIADGTGIATDSNAPQDDDINYTSPEVMAPDETDPTSGEETAETTPAPETEESKTTPKSEQATKEPETQTTPTPTKEEETKKTDGTKAPEKTDASKTEDSKADGSMIEGADDDDVVDMDGWEEGINMDEFLASLGIDSNDLNLNG